MQIKFDKVSYKNLNNLTFEIEDKKITGILCSDIKDLINISYLIGNNIKENGTIKYSNKSYKNKVRVVSISKLDDLLDGKVSDYVNFDNVDKEIFKLINIKERIQNRNINTLSNTEKIKILFLNEIQNDYDTLLFNGIFEELDFEERKTFIKLIINLKKFYKKTIIICSIDIDIIYEFIDNIIIINNNMCLSGNNKFEIFDQNINIEEPFIKKIEKLVLKKHNINLGNNDNINELIKAIYREVR